MIAEPNISLREVAKRLGRILRLRKGQLPLSRLLRLLQSGDLKAGFLFPGHIASWIPIPTAYWASVGTDKFRSLGYAKNDKHKTGTFKVQISPFADEYVRIVSQAVEKDRENKGKIQSTATVFDELKVAISAASDRYEVVIPECEWADYLARHELEEPASETKAKSGRHEKTGWRDLSVIIGAYIIKHYQTTKEQIKIEEASKKIYELAKDDNISNLPSAPTIKDTLSKIRSKAETISIN